MVNRNYSIQIQAPCRHVYETMLEKSAYDIWTKEFHPTSTYEGNWEKGSKMLFIGVDENGKRNGMISEIMENIPGKIVSIKHYGMVDGDNEIVEGPEVEKWANAIETYQFDEVNGNTTLLVTLGIPQDHENYFDDAWNRALNKLKKLCEG